MRKISLLDSTLRDGAQAAGVSFSLQDKLGVIRLLDRVGIDIIEAGNPFSNPKDFALYRRASELKLSHARLAAFGSTRRKATTADADPNLQALLAAETPVCVLFGKSALFQVDRVLETTAQENLNMIAESCRLLKDAGRQVVFDAEHFFDGWAENPDYALQCLRAAAAGGADTLCLCDTNGGVFPGQVQAVLERLTAEIQLPLGVHFHSDCGMAEANSLIAVLAGAEQVQGTFLGFGERCGNANLCTVIANLQLKLGLGCIPDESLPALKPFAHEMAEIHNVDLSPRLPYVGDNAFFHKAGMHAAAILKDTRSFEHVPPEAVGNHRRFPASEFSGKSVILAKIRQLLPDIEPSAAEEILAEVKALESSGYQFEGADASFQLLVRRHQGQFTPPFQLINYRIYTGADSGDGNTASATVKVQVGNSVQLMAAEGNGPVNALDAALRKALEIYYPTLSKVKLVDYRVRVLDSKDATAAAVRVLITSTDGQKTFTTVGVSQDVVAASWRALAESMAYILIRD